MAIIILMETGGYGADYAPAEKKLNSNYAAAEPSVLARKDGTGFVGLAASEGRPTIRNDARDWQGNGETDANVDDQGACGQLVFAKRLPLISGNAWCIKQVCKGEASFQYGL